MFGPFVLAVLETMVDETEGQGIMPRSQGMTLVT